MVLPVGGGFTRPDNAEVSGFEFNANPEAGSTIKNRHWEQSKRYEEEIERNMGMEYEEFATKMNEVADLEEEGVKELWVCYDKASDTQRKAYELAFGTINNELEEAANLLTASSVDSVELTEDDKLEYIRTKPLDFS